MATVIKETSTLNVILQDTGDRTTTKKLDFPVSGLSLADVDNAFKPMFSATNTTGKNLFQNPSSGLTIVGVKGAEYVDTRVSTTPLE